MIRTTITMPIALHQRLMWASKTENKSITKLAQELLALGLADREKKKTVARYAVLTSLIGISKGNDQHLSESIDQILYGKGGAWQGNGA